MLTKILNMVSVTLYAFVVSYLLASVFDKYGLQTNTITIAIITILATFIIVAVTVIVITLINRHFASNKFTK